MSKKIFIAVVVLITLFMITSALIDMNKRANSIETNKYETVARIYKFSSNRSFSSYYFEYFYNGQKYQNNDDIDYGNREKCVDKFYRVNLSTENPNYCKIFLDQEIIDSVEITNAGFE